MKNSQAEQRAKLMEILKSFDTCMLVSRGAEGEMSARPMAIARIDPDLKVWFITSISSDQVGDVLNDSHMTITAQREHSAYISLSGSGHALQNSEMCRELWGPAFDVWFPKGPNDADLALIEFEPQRGEYWDSRGIRKVTFAMEMVKAYVSGKTPDTSGADYHGRVNLEQGS